MEDGRRKEWNEATKEKRKEMILRPLPSLFLCFCFPTLQIKSISHFLHVLHSDSRLLIYPNAMGGGAEPSPQHPPVFFKLPIFHTHLCKLSMQKLSLYFSRSFHSYIVLSI